MHLKAKLTALRGNSFVRAASVLVGGTAAGQVLIVLDLPFLTRLYSPEEFSLLAVYVALLTMISVIACLRFDIAIPIPEDDCEAANLLALALGFALLTALLVASVVFFFGSWFFATLGQPDLQPYGWLLPFGVWLAGSYAAFQYWATRKKRFTTIARTRIVQAGSGVTAQLGFGWFSTGPFGLMLGHALMSGAGALALARQTLASDRPALSAVSRRGMLEVLKKYKRFPQYSTFEALANNASIQLPMILIAALALGPEAGFVLLAVRALGTPVTLIGGAVGKVYFSRAAQEMREGRLPEFTARILKNLALVMIGPLVFIAVIAPDAFALVFGEEWRRAGELVIWMTPWFVFKLASASISSVMHVRSKQSLFLLLMILVLIIRVGGTYVAFLIDPLMMAEGLAISGAVATLLSASVYIFVSGQKSTIVSHLLVYAILCSLSGFLAAHGVIILVGVLL